MKKWQWIMDLLSLICVVAAGWMVFYYAPLEAVMGEVQRIFYFHVAAGWVGMLSFFLAMLFSILYLSRKDKRWDFLAVSAIEIGFVFVTVNVISGSIWARPIWNTWWTWDPRLTTAAIMLLIYAAYFILRASLDDSAKQSRFSAVYAIIGFVSVPMTFLSIRLFRTIHPVLIGGLDPSSMGTFDMTQRMALTLMVSLMAFTILYASLLLRRYRLAQLSDELQQQQAILRDESFTPREN